MLRYFRGTGKKKDLAPGMIWENGDRVGRQQGVAPAIHLLASMTTSVPIDFHDEMQSWTERPGGGCSSPVLDASTLIHYDFSLIGIPKHSRL